MLHIVLGHMFTLQMHNRSKSSTIISTDNSYSVRGDKIGLRCEVCKIEHLQDFFLSLISARW